MSENENESSETQDAAALPIQLDAIEARILGSLIEKQATTPDAYPLTLNAVVSACNQKSNRDPMMELEPGEVGHALRQLEGKGLVTGSLAARASRYAHRFDAGYDVTSRQRALLSVLLLRGAQTLNELFVRSERLADFTDLDEVRGVLDRLAAVTPPFVVRLARASGQREDRYMHLLCGPVDPGQPQPGREPPAASRGGLAERVEQLEARLDAMQQELDALRGERRGRDTE